MGLPVPSSIPSSGAVRRIVPAESFRAAFDALAQPVAGERDAAFQRLRVNDLVRGRSAFAGLPLDAHVVLDSELHRVHADGFGSPVRNLFEREMPLRSAERPVRPAGRRVGVGEIAVVADVGASVQVQRALPRAANDARTGRQVGARIHERRGVDGGNLAVCSDAHSQRRNRRVAVSAGHELLLAAGFQLHRATGALGENGGERGQPRLVLVAVSRAHVQADNADALARDAQRQRQQQPILVNAAT